MYTLNLMITGKEYHDRLIDNARKLYKASRAQIKSNPVLSAITDNAARKLEWRIREGQVLELLLEGDVLRAKRALDYMKERIPLDFPVQRTEFYMRRHDFYYSVMLTYARRKYSLREAEFFKEAKIDTSQFSSIDFNRWDIPRALLEYLIRKHFERSRNPDTYFQVRY